MSNRYSDLVCPMTATEQTRWIHFSSACRPFGMVNLSPDTVMKEDWGGGFVYGEKKVQAFSHLHAWQMSAVPVLPTVGAFRGHQGVSAYESPADHSWGRVEAGYHEVFLERYGVRAELTSTTRVGLHRYHFPKCEEAYIQFDLGAELGPSQMEMVCVDAVSPTRLEGYVVNAPTFRRPKPVKIYFVVETDTPSLAFGAWREGGLLRSASHYEGAGVGCFWRYQFGEATPVAMKVTLSYTSIANADLNLRSEAGSWDFDRYVHDSKKDWDGWLGRIRVEGASNQQRKKFYTDLFHALLGRRIVSDVDGSYIDNTGPEPRVRRMPLRANGIPHNHHNFDAMWGAQWAIAQLWSLAYPEVMDDFCHTMVEMYKNGGLIPRGPSGGNYTFVMTGASSTPFLATALLKGCTTVDPELAYEGMRKNHGPGGLMSKAGYEHNYCVGGGVDHYIERGYVPNGIDSPEGFHRKCVSQTLEYASQDWALAQVARKLGKFEDAEHFEERSKNFRHLFDADLQFFRPRNFDGEFQPDFDPDEDDGFCEGNARMYRWYVPHDPEALASLYGGKAAAASVLEAQFEAALPGNLVAAHGRHVDNSIDYGNQPSTYLAHLFHYFDRPDLTQKWVSEIYRRLKSQITPDAGYGGDEDQGLMGALNVLFAIGLFDVQMGCAPEPSYAITTPLFQHIEVDLHPDYTPSKATCFRILNQQEVSGAGYILEASLHGAPLEKWYVRHQSLIEGAELALRTGHFDKSRIRSSGSE